MSAPLSQHTTTRLPEGLRVWLTTHATSLDESNRDSDYVLPVLAAEGLFRIGVPREWGGLGGDTFEALNAIADVSELSLTAGFMFWGHRTFIEYVLQSSNAALRERWLPSLLDGTQAGATGLSNAMKFLSGIEALSVHATARGDGWRLNGSLPWITNVRPERFVAAAAVERDNGIPFIAALASNQVGVKRSADLDLISLRGSDTAALKIESVDITEADMIADNALLYLPRVRPAFLGMQCGLSVGLARASLRAADELGRSARLVLGAPLAEVSAQLAHVVQALREGLADQRFIAQPAGLFRLRIQLADIVQKAVQLELQASGGRAYLRDQPLGFARRLREAAFIPVVTPSLTQLQGVLQAQVAGNAA